MTEPTDTGWWVDAERDPVHVAAADWWSRLQDQRVSLEDLLAWQEWIAADAKHAQAFSRIEEVSLILRQVKAPRSVGRWDLARDRYDASVPASDWKSPASRPRVKLAVAASVVLGVVAVGGAASSLFREPGPVPGRTVFVTAVGENKTAMLSDGSKITLGGNTQVEVALSAHARWIELSRGEAFFVVAKDRSRPFTVHAGDATVTAVGTQFNVHRDSDRAVVAVTEGRVVVNPVAHFLPVTLLREFKPKLRPVRVDAGEQTTAGSAGIEEASKVDDPSATTAWQAGRLAFRLQPLRYVLEDVNRYASKPIVLQDESVGSRTITGTVSLGELAGWIDSLRRVFDLEVVEEPDRIVLRKR
jgi:transmembrane sensor